MDEAYPRWRSLRQGATCDYDQHTGEGATPTDGTDPKLARWLQSRIDEALLDGPATPRPRDLSGDDDAPTNPGAPRRRLEPMRHPPGWGAAHEEDADDVETVLGRFVPRLEDDEDHETVLGRWRPNLEDDHDPATVQRTRLPVSFIGESVMDDHTVQDIRAPAVHWREETARERRRKIHEKAEELVERLEVSQSSVEGVAPRPVPLRERSATERVLLGLCAAALLAVALVLVGAFFLI